MQFQVVNSSGVLRAVWGYGGKYHAGGLGQVNLRALAAKKTTKSLQEKGALY